MCQATLALCFVGPAEGGINTQRKGIHGKSRRRPDQSERGSALCRGDVPLPDHPDRGPFGRPGIAPGSISANGNFSANTSGPFYFVLDDASVPEPSSVIL